MTRATDNYQLLIQKLDEFTRKYYLNRAVKGMLYSIALGFASFLAIALAESYFYFPSGVRMVLFWGFVGANLYFVSKWLIVPVMGYNRLGKVISHEKAATIIGQHFTDVQDRLLNVLQLGDLASATDSDLIRASIDQKIMKLKPVPFTGAVNISSNKKYLKYALPPLLIFFALLLSSPNLIKDSTKRLIYSNAHFEKEAPFRFLVDNENLQTLQFEPFTLEVSLDGKLVPSEMHINLDGHNYKMKRTGKGHFAYEVRNPQKDIPFHLEAGQFRSGDFELRVLPKPMILGFEVKMEYPSYLNKKNESLANIGDLTIPEGTQISWMFNAKNTSSITMGFEEERLDAKRASEDLFRLERTLTEDGPYTIYVSNEEVVKADSIGYFLNVIPDQHPTLSVQQMQDSVNTSYVFFMGEAADDYGLIALNFFYKTSDQEGYEKRPLSLNPGTNYSRFSHYVDVKEMDLEPGVDLSYYFETWDNDGVNGSKSTRSAIMKLELPSAKELEELTEKTSEKIKDELEESIKETKELKKEFKDIKEELYQKKDLNWDDRKAIESLLERQKELSKSIENIKEEFKKNRSRQKEVSKESEKLEQKYDQLQKIMEETLPDELKELMKELEDMLEKLKKKDAVKDLEDFEYSNDQMNKDLDRMLELFKQLEFEMKLERTAEKLEKLAEEQEQLGNKTQNKNNDMEELSKEQEKMNEEFDDIKEDMEELDKMNEELNEGSDPLDKDNLDEEISKKQEESMEQMEKGNRKESSGSQKDASQKMQQLADQMKQAQQNAEKEQMELDLDAIRQLLENLVTLSFDQEDLMDELKEVDQNNPRYVQIVQEQHKLKEQSSMIEDSLLALSKRITEIESYVTKEMGKVNRKMQTSIKNLEDRRVAWAARDQQYVMTSTNNLAVMLLEVMKSLQEQMAQSMKTPAMCNKPGSGKKSAKSMGQKQSTLNQDMKKMKSKMESGKMGQGEMSKEMAKMAKRQAHLREELRKLNEEMNKDGKGAMGDLEKLQEEMEKTETDLVNKRLTEAMMRRQEEILTRLLKAADAERERELDDKRESEQPKEYSREIPPELEEYFKQREAELELYKTLPPSLKPYYRKMVENYFKTISY